MLQYGEEFRSQLRIVYEILSRDISSTMTADVLEDLREWAFALDILCEEVLRIGGEEQHASKNFAQATRLLRERTCRLSEALFVLATAEDAQLIEKYHVEISSSAVTVKEIAAKLFNLVSGDDLIKLSN